MGYKDGEAVVTILTKTGVSLQSNSEGFEVKIQSETRTWHMITYSLTQKEFDFLVKLKIYLRDI